MERVPRVVLAPVVLLLAVGGCSASRTVPAASQGITSVAVGTVGVSLAAALASDRSARAAEIGLPERVSAKVGEYLRVAGLSSPDGADRLRVDIDRFRLPRSARWLSGQMKGNDYLGGQIRIERDDGVLEVGHAYVQLGAGDRSIAENYSHDRALRSLVDQFAWEVAWALTGVAGSGEEPLLQAGKDAGLAKAVNVLGARGQLSYGEAAKYAASGTLSMSVAAQYDACSAKKVFTLGLSDCNWDTHYRGEPEEAP